MDSAAAGEEAGRALLGTALRATEGWEFRTFLCGTTPPPDLPPEEAEAFRRGANRGLGRALEEAWGGARSVAFRDPEARLLARFPGGTVEIRTVPLAVYGRYRKSSRALPQTPFHCPACRGRGRACGACGGTGRLLPGSVAELLVPRLVEASGAEEGVFSGSGREDADVRMLGEGRPFVVTLRCPRRRALDFPSLAAAAGSPGVAEFPVLHPVAAEEAARVPATHPPKRYRARVAVEGGAGEEEAALLGIRLSGAVLAQRTPVRVARRRADRVRERRVLEAEASVLPGGDLELRVRTEGGTYVKEMISGDGGRTEPSAASILGRPCFCTALDVLAVEMEDPPPAPWA